MKRVQLIIGLVMSLSLFTNCETESFGDDVSNSQEVNKLLNNGETKALLNNGINPLTGNVEKLSTTLFNRSIEGYKINDYFVDSKQLSMMTNALNEGNSKLFATTNRIGLPIKGKRRIRVGAVINGVDKLDRKQSRTVQAAVIKYNQLGMKKLTFRFVEITEQEAINGFDEKGPIDITIFVDSDNSFVGNADGRAFFPNNRNPGEFIGLNSNTINLGLKNLQLLLMHELGHTIGMAHSDFLTRGTCGNTNPLDPELGDLAGVPNVSSVCNIVGTDSSGNFSNSVMRACGFFIFHTPNFTTEDRKSFRRLYRQVGLPCDN